MKRALTGGAAMAEALRQINPDVMPVYPITPQTPIIETFAKFKASQKVDTEIITVESEHSAISACVGSSASGARTITATSSQGLALMNEILYIASGMHLPILMLVSARALSAPINIHGDHSDMMGARDTGWIQIFSENVQEAYDNTLIGLKLAEKTSLPVMVAMDGFITSHSVEVLETIKDEIVKKFIGDYKPKQSLLNLDNPVSYGPVGLPDSYFEFKLKQVKAVKNVFQEAEKIYFDFKKMSDRKYNYIETYKIRDAEKAIIAMGSVAGTIKDVVDNLRQKGEKVGLVKIEMFRPFPYKKIANVLSGVKKIAVLDRSLGLTSLPPLYGDILNAFYREKLNNSIKSYVYGLGGRDIYRKQIEEIFEKMDQEIFFKKEVEYIQ